MKVSKTAKFGVFGSSPTSDNQALHVIPVQKATTKPNSSKVDSKVSSTTTGPDIEQLILNTLSSNDEIKDSWEFATANNIDHQVVVGGIKSLLPDDYIKGTGHSSTSFYIKHNHGR